MEIEQALKWADIWGQVPSNPPRGDAQAMTALADEVRRLRGEAGNLRAFAQDVMQCWPMGDLDGGELQDAAEKHGLLRPETRHEPCCEGCSCAEYALPVEFSDGVTCYRKTPLLTGKTHNAGNERTAD